MVGTEWLFSLKFLLLVSSTAKTWWGQYLAALSSCLSFHLCLCVSNLLGALGKMLILVALCNYSDPLGLMHVYSTAPIRIWPYVVLIFFCDFFPLFSFPLPDSKFSLHSLNCSTTVRIIFKQCFKINYRGQVTNMIIWEQFPGLSGSNAGQQFYGPQLALCSLEEC